MQPIKFNHIDGYINRLTHFYFIAFYYMPIKLHQIIFYTQSVIN